MRPKFFWKLALTFLALLLSVLLAVDFLAERTLRNSYQAHGFQELKTLATVLRREPLPASSQQTPDNSALNSWVKNAAANGVRVTLISSDGTVLADSESETQTMETHAGRPEVLQALQSGEGQSTRYSVSVKRPLLYYAVRANFPDGTPVILRLALPVESIDQELATFRTRLWLWSLLILLLSAVVALLISRSYTDRIERLREFSVRVAE